MHRAVTPQEGSQMTVQPAPNNRQTLNYITTERPTRYKNFQQNNTFGTYLANQLQCNREKPLITTVRNSQSAQAINETFHTLYVMYIPPKRPLTQQLFNCL